MNLIQCPEVRNQEAFERMLAERPMLAYTYMRFIQDKGTFTTYTESEGYREYTEDELTSFYWACCYYQMSHDYMIVALRGIGVV